MLSQPSNELGNMLTQARLAKCELQYRIQSNVFYSFLKWANRICPINELTKFVKFWYANTNKIFGSFVCLNC